MEVDIQIERAAEALDQRYCTGLGSPLDEPCLFITCVAMVR